MSAFKELMVKVIGILALVLVIVFSFISVGLMVVHASLCSNQRCQQCPTGYSLPPSCTYFECFGINSTNTGTVCNGNGKCLRPNFCECFTNYSGTNCSLKI
eukprot:gene6219-10225_t